MVADEVTVETRRAGARRGLALELATARAPTRSRRWRSTTAPARGARVTLHLNDASHEYAEAAQDRAHRARAFRRGRRADRPRSTSPAPSRAASPTAPRSGRSPKSDVTPEEYTEFYRGLSGQYDEPALTAHWRAEGRHEYTVLAFVPGSRPFDLFDPARKGRNKLYVRRVLITQDADLLPSWLRFVRLVVDSADLPLNVSREMIQESAVFTAIRKGVTNRIMQELTKLAENEAEKFAKVWENFGAVIKEGLYEDPERRDAIYKIRALRLDDASRRRPHAGRLCQGPAREPDRDLSISPATTPSASPRARSSRVFARAASRCCCSPIPSTRSGSRPRPASTASRSSRSARARPTSSRSRWSKARRAPAEASAEVATLIAYFKQTLESEIADARASDRLTDSVACLVAPEFGPDRQLERMLAAHGRVSERVKPVLEVNATHPLTAALAKRFKDGADKALVDDAAWLLLDEARLVDGETLKDAPAFAARLRRVMEKALG